MLMDTQTAPAATLASTGAQAHETMLQAALAQQRQAHLAHPYPTLQERKQDLQALYRLIDDNRDAICEAISRDYGHRSTHETILTEIIPALTGIKHVLKHMGGWMKAQRRDVDWRMFFGARNRVMPQPLGVVGVIVPWNFPINLSMIPLTYIFAAGNRAMVKMSENSRHLAALLMQKAPAYFGPEKLQFFDETGGVGVAFSAQPFDHLLFTGSGQTGRAVMAAAARNLCPVTLELGGKCPALVCDDMDLRTAADRIGFVKYLNAGQICTTVDHVWMPRAKVEAFVQLLREQVAARYSNVSSPDFTAVIDVRSFERLRSALDEVQQRGAQVIPLLPGPAWDEAAHKLTPHVVVGAPMDSALMQREIFGPILPVLPYDHVDEVVQHVNAGPRPLAIYPFSRDQKVIESLITRVMSGGVTVNDALMHVAQHDLPFGGVGESGMGHYHGREGFFTFSKLRPIFYQARWSSMKLLMPPYGKRADQIMRFLRRWG